MSNYREKTDEELLELAHQNEDKAADELCKRYSRFSLYTASAFSNNKEEIKDLSQEGMIGFLSALFTFESSKGASFSSYAKVCIRNRILSYHRKSLSQKREGQKTLLSMDDISELEVFGEDPEETLVSKSRSAEISEIIEKELSKNERSVLSLFLSGFSYKEISEELSLSEKGVDGALQRARKKLREKFKP